MLNKIVKSALSACLCGIILFASGQAFADSQVNTWSTVTGGNANTYSTQATLPDNMVQMKNTIPLPNTPGFSVISNSTLYAVDGTKNNVIYAVDLATNTLKWQYADADASAAINRLIAGDGVVYVQIGTRLYALKDNGSSASVSWTVNVPQINQAAYDSSKVFYTLTDANGSLALVVLDAATGIEQHRYTVSDVGEYEFGRITVGDGHLFLIIEHGVEIIESVDEATGKIVWTSRIGYGLEPSSNNLSYIGGKLYLDLEPTIYDSALSAQPVNQIAAFDAATGKNLWKYALASDIGFTHTGKGNQNIFSVNGDSVFIMSDDGNLTAINKDTGIQRWKVKYEDNQNSALPFSNGKLISTQNRIILENNKKLKIFDTSTSALVRVISLADADYSPEAIVDNMFIGYGTNDVIFAPPDPASDTVKPWGTTFDNNHIQISPYENPNTLITVQVTVSETALVKVRIVNKSYQTVRNINLWYKDAQWSDLSWDGRDDQGKPVPYGNYHFVFDLTDLAGNKNTCDLTSKVITVGPVGAKVLVNSNIRFGPGTQYNVVDTINAGSSVQIQNEVGNWYQIQYQGQDYAKTGYIAKSLLSTAPNPATTVKYTVQSGDTLSKIAAKYNVTVTDIVNANNIANVNSIYVGESLVIPVKSQAPQPVTYVVVSGDTLWSIANKYHVTTDSIIKNNNLSNPNNLYVGQKLVIQ